MPSNKQRLKRDLQQLQQSLPTAPPSPSQFRAGLLIDADVKATPFRPDPWQEQDFQALAPGWLQVAGFPVQGTPIQRAWQERPRGHSKTSDLAVMAAWALAHAQHPIKGVAAVGPGREVA